MVGVTTKRTPINRPSRTRVTPAALEAFRAMQRLERRCACKDDDDCPACQQWGEQHAILHSELRLAPWQWPAYEHPDDVDAFQSDHADPGGPAARYRMLKQAARGLKPV
jgi:hypothetical protein